MSLVPAISLRAVVSPDWIDINGHMNATRYGLAVYEAHVRFSGEIGLGDDYVQKFSYGKAVVESHMRYEREVALGDEIEVHSWLLGVDRKRLHFFHELQNLTKGCRAATSEQVDVHFDLRTRRSAPLPDWLYAQLRACVDANLAMPAPNGVGSHLRPPRNAWRAT